MTELHTEPLNAMLNKQAARDRAYRQAHRERILDIVLTGDGLDRFFSELPLEAYEGPIDEFKDRAAQDFLLWCLENKCEQDLGEYLCKAYEKWKESEAEHAGNKAIS